MTLGQTLLSKVINIIIIKDRFGVIPRFCNELRCSQLLDLPLYYKMFLLSPVVTEWHGQVWIGHCLESQFFQFGWKILTTGTRKITANVYGISSGQGLLISQLNRSEK